MDNVCLMVKDVKMCKSAGKTVPAHHGKKQKGGKKQVAQTPIITYPPKSGADNP
jgi:hypothetical protein